MGNVPTGTRRPIGGGGHAATHSFALHPFRQGEALARHLEHGSPQRRSRVSSQGRAVWHHSCSSCHAAQHYWGGIYEGCSSTQRLGTQRLGRQRPGTQRPGIQRTGTRRPGIQRTGTRRPGTQRPGTQHPGGGTPGTQRPNAQALHCGCREPARARGKSSWPRVAHAHGKSSWPRAFDARKSSSCQALDAGWGLRRRSAWSSVRTAGGGCKSRRFCAGPAWSWVGRSARPQKPALLSIRRTSRSRASRS
mmetsp:Transcript_30620/g.66823  ORF Transcript_30620/g.66823 Transcript_30620/m.66823 type:complete len:249 (-) Transcript_30620:129-875(-)